MLIEENYTNGKYKIGYIYNKSESELLKYLIVTFSAIPSEDSPIKHQYSFMRVLEDIPCNKLFLQDSLGEYGTYYLCYHMDFEVAKEVNLVIEKVRIECRVEKENVICIGSSKGATASLYHAIYGNYGHAISMGPQIYISKFLNTSNRVHISILNSMIGENDFSESCKVLDSIMLDIIKQREQTNIHILTSSNDKQYKEHIIPLLEVLDICSQYNDVLVDNRILSHSDLASYNPGYVRRKIYEIFLGCYKDYVLDDFLYEDNSIDVMHLGLSLVCNKKTYEEVFNSLIKPSYCIEICGDLISISLDMSSNDLRCKDIKYVFYIVNENNETIERTEYLDNPSAKFSVGKGRFRVKYYLKYHGYSKSYYTKMICVE